MLSQEEQRERIEQRQRADDLADWQDRELGLEFKRGLHLFSRSDKVMAALSLGVASLLMVLGVFDDWKTGFLMGFLILVTLLVSWCLTIADAEIDFLRHRARELGQPSLGTEGKTS